MTSLLQFRSLLRLPPVLRSSIFYNLKRQAPGYDVFKRSFGTSSRLRAEQAKSSPPPPPKPRIVRPPGSNAKAPAPPPSVPSTPEIQPTPSSSLLRKINPHLRRQLQDTGGALLYSAPPHGSFVFTSYLFGVLFVFSSVTFIGFTSDEKKMSWYTRLPVTFISLFYAAVGTAFLLAPSKMIRSVSLVLNSTGSMPLLRFSMRGPLPFTRTLQIDAALDDVYIDKKIVGMEMPPYHNLPLNEIQNVGTQEFADGFKKSSSTMLGFVKRLLPNLYQDIRKIFWRDGIVYIRIEDRGLCKLDLRHALLLDHGKPLIAAMVPSERDRSWIQWLRTLLGN